MTDSKKTGVDLNLYQGLQALSDLSFPKLCANCGKRYETADEFINRTEALDECSGLKKDIGDNDEIIVELFRNCTCGSTLMDEFSDRRNLSANGIKRREKFGELLDRLTRAGFPIDVAREELLKVMRGEGSEKLGVNKQVKD